MNFANNVFIIAALVAVGAVVAGAVLYIIRNGVTREVIIISGIVIVGTIVVVFLAYAFSGVGAGSSPLGQSTYSSGTSSSNSSSIPTATNTLEITQTVTPSPTMVITPSPTATPTSCTNSFYANDYDKVTAQANPAYVHPGDQFTLYFTLCNIGSTTWSSGGSYTFQCDDVYHTQPSGGYTPSCMSGGIIGFGNQSVAPGQTYTFYIHLTAPQQTGNYQTWWDLRGPNGIIPSNNNYIDVYVS